jgi:hypothetical protein
VPVRQILLDRVRNSSCAVLSVTGLALPGSTATVLADGHEQQGRWDLVQILRGTVLAGGTDRGSDAATGDVVFLTGSGDFEPREREATGGGTFVHQHSDGSEVAHGVYVVTQFRRWRPAGGSLVPLDIRDGIGVDAETTAGILTMTVRLFPEGGDPVDAILKVNCDLPGDSFVIEEGIQLQVGTLQFTQNGDATLVHRLR